MSIKLSNAIVLVLFLTVAFVSTAFRPASNQQKCIRREVHKVRMISDDANDALSRRRKRRGKDEVTVNELTKVSKEHTLSTL